jgi:hypothetical protein
VVGAASCRDDSYFAMSFELSAMSCALCALGEQQFEGDQDQDDAAEDFHAVGEFL